MQTLVAQSHAESNVIRVDKQTTTTKKEEGKKTFATYLHVPLNTVIATANAPHTQKTFGVNIARHRQICANAYVRKM